MCWRSTRTSSEKMAGAHGQAQEVPVETHPADVSVLSLDGPLRAPTTPRLRRRVEALLGNGERAILLDMTGVAEIDAAGIGELVRAYTAATALDGSFAIANVSRKVRRLLDRARLSRLLGADTDRDIQPGYGMGLASGPCI